MQALVFKVTNSDGFRRLSSEKVDLGDINTNLKSMYKAIDCKMIEHATINSFERECKYDIWVNENGMFENQLNLKFINEFGISLPVYGDIIVTNSHVDNDGNMIDDGMCDAIAHDVINTVMIAFEALNG